MEELGKRNNSKLNAFNLTFSSCIDANQRFEHGYKERWGETKCVYYLLGFAFAVNSKKMDLYMYFL